MNKKILLIAPFLNLLGHNAGGKSSVVLKYIDFYIEKNNEVYIFPIKEDFREFFTWKHKERNIKILPTRGLKGSLGNIKSLVQNFCLNKSYISSLINGEHNKFVDAFKNDFDIVHSLYTSSNYNNFLIDIVPKNVKKISTYYHGPSKKYHKNDLNIFISKDQKYKYSPDNGVVIYPPVLNSKSTNSKLDIKNDYIVFIGVIEPRKRLYLLLQALKIVKNKFPFKLLIIGSEHYDLNYYSKCYEYAKLNDLNVEFKGFISEDKKLSYISSDNCKGMFMPSSIEGFGIAYIECFLKRVRCIGYDKVINDFNSTFNENLGVPFDGDNNNPDDLAKCILEFQNNYLKPIPENVITDIEKKFSLEYFKKQLNEEIFNT